MAAEWSSQRRRRRWLLMAGVVALIAICTVTECSSQSVERFDLPTPTFSKWQVITYNKTSPVANDTVLLWTFPTDSRYSDVLLDYLYVETDKYSRIEQFGSPVKLPAEWVGVQFFKNVSSAAFKFRYRRIGVSPEISVDVSPGPKADQGWVSQNYTAEDMTSTRWLFKAPNDSCAIILNLIPYSGVGFSATVYPFGFNPQIVHEGGSSKADDEAFDAKQDSTVYSNGPVLGVEFHFSPSTDYFSFSDLPELAPFTIGFKYRVDCMQPAPFAKPDATVWRTILLPYGNQFALVQNASNATCWTEIIALSTYGLAEQDDDYMWDPYQTEQGSEFRVTCPGKATALLGQLDLYQSRCDKPILVQVIFAAAQVAFRRRCLSDPNETSSVPPYYPQLPGYGQHLRARFSNRTFTQSTGAENHRGFNLPRAWTIQAVRPQCRIQLQFKTIDADRVAVLEDFSFYDLGKREVPAMISIGGQDEDYYSTETVTSVQHGFTYLSCSNRVIVQATHSRWTKSYFDNYFKGTYQQRCAKPRPSDPACGVYYLTLSADWQWKTFEFKAINFNQVGTTSLIIRPDVEALKNLSRPLRNVYLEIEFVSLVQQTFLGMVRGFEGSAAQVSQTHNVYLTFGASSRRIRATLGESEFIRLHKSTDNVTITSDLVLPRGSHIFTANYRLVFDDRRRNSSLSPIPIKKQPDVTLTATTAPKRLNFKIPKQFSLRHRQNIFRHLTFLQAPEYETIAETAYVDQWAFRYRWVIRPQNASCRVAIKFSKLDISNGRLVDERHLYLNNQHRLFVLHFADNGIAPNASYSCTGLPLAQNTTANSVCSRLNTNYLSSGHALGLVFQSTTYEEYEKATEDLFPYSGVETTWGSGWTASYWQACSDHELEEVEMGNAPENLTATARWSSNLPGLPTQDDSLLFFADKRYLISPRHRTCLVEFMYTVETLGAQQDIPIQLTDMNGQPILDLFGKTPQLGVRILGKSPASKVHFRYREIC